MIGTIGKGMMAAMMTVAVLAAPAKAQDDGINILSESYPPFSFMEYGQFKGASLEQIDLIMKNAAITYRQELLPWSRAIKMAETQARFCVGTTAHTIERDTKFKWVEPVLADNMMLVRRLGSEAKPATLEEARQYIVGTQRDDFTADVLKAKQFSRIDLATEFDLTLTKLLRGRIDLMPMSLKAYKKLRKQGVPIEVTVLLTTQKYGIACNKAISDDEIARMQSALDAIIADGTQAALFAKYGIETEDH